MVDKRRKVMIRQGYEHHRIHRPLFKSKLYKKVKKLSYEAMCAKFNNVIELVDLDFLWIKYYEFINDGNIKRDLPFGFFCDTYTETMNRNIIEKN